MKEPTAWLAIYRWLARAYPRSLRRELGAEMERLFVDLYVEAAAVSRARAARFALRACTEVVPRALRAHGDPDSPSGAFRMRPFLTDLRFAWRSATRRPRYSAAVALTMALGIGATTAVFSLVDAAILRRLPFPDGDRLVEVLQNIDRRFAVNSLDGALLEAQRQRHDVFDRVEGVDVGDPVALLGEEPLRLSGAAVTPGLLEMLGARPLVGRLLHSEDAVVGAMPVVLISERLWREQFAATLDLESLRLSLDDVDHSIVGVLAADFAFPYARTAVWTPTVHLGESAPARLRTYARLADGLTVAAAQERADAVAVALEESSPRRSGWSVRLLPMNEQRTIERTRTAMWTAFGAAALLLLVATLNVAQVALSHAIRREGEMSIRAALGAGRRRLVRQMIFESLLVSLIGGAAGILLAYWMVAGFALVAPDDLVRLDAIVVAIDARALGFALLASSLAGLLAGLTPTLTVRPGRLSRALRSNHGGLTESRGRRRVQSGLIAFETGTAFVLLSVAALLLFSFVRFAAIDPGFDAEKVVSVVMQLDEDRYPNPDTRGDFLDAVAANMRRIPGVQAAIPAGGGAPSPGGTAIIDTLYLSDGSTIEDDFIFPHGNVAEGYFAAVGVDVLEGRPLVDSDADTTAVVVSESFAGRVFGDRSAVGQGFRFSETAEWFDIVGVVEDVSTFGLNTANDDYQLYYPLRAHSRPGTWVGVVVRADAPLDLVPALKRAVWQHDARQPITEVRLGADTVAGWVTEPRFYSLLLGVFAVVATLLVGVGIFGVVAHGVAARRREIGIRVALGADRRSILGLSAARGMRPVALGLAVGALGVWYVGRLVSALLYDIPPTDPVALATAVGVFLGAALAASYIPAWQSLRIDTVRALRSD